MKLSEATSWILYLVFVQCVISSDHDHCMQSACICERTRLICNPHHMGEEQQELLDEIPTPLREQHFPAFEEADFRYNNIGDVKTKSFHGLHNLNILWLSHNQVSMLDSHAFSGATALQIIDLSYNRLEIFETRVLASEPHLLNLHTIDVSHNSIKSIEAHSFIATPNLKQLYLHNNPLTSLNGAPFVHCQSLNTLFIDGIIKDCACDWLETMETLKARTIDIMDEHHVMTHCIDEWRAHCDVSHIHQITLDALRHHAPHTDEITFDDLQAPVVNGNGTLVFPDGDGEQYPLNSVDGKRALYQYDWITRERIGQIEDDEKRKSFQDVFRKRMTDFIRKHYFLNGIVNGTNHNMTLSDLSPHDWETTLQKRPTNGSTPDASKTKQKPKKMKKKGVPTNFIWLIVGGLGAGLLVVLLVSLQHIDWKDHSIKDPEKEKRKKEKKKCCGWFGTMTGKLSVRKQFVKGTTERKHAKQKFARSTQSNFAVLHGQAKQKMDEINGGQHPPSPNFGRYTTPSNHIVAPQQAPPYPKHSANLGPPPAPPVPTTTGLRRMSVDEGIRKMVTSQRDKVRGGQRTPSEGSTYYFDNFYTDSEDDIDEETDLFRR
nr:uncharacterized protein LOC129274528 [Lytechinus pictus]